MKFFKMISILFIIFIVLSEYAFSAEVKGNIVIFPQYTGRSSEDNSLKNIQLSLREIFNSTGRYLPVEDVRKMDAIKKSDGKKLRLFYENVAKFLDVERYVLLNVSVRPRRSVLRIRSFSIISGKFKEEFSKDIFTNNYVNLPGKASIYYLDRIKKLSLRASVKIKKANGNLVIDRGQWSGLESGIFDTNFGKVKVLSTGRYISYIQSESLKQGDVVDFKIYPEVNKLKKTVNRELLENNVRKFGIDPVLNRRNGSVKESIISTCIINPGANFCLPVYGSFLATEYLGLKNTEEHWPGLFIAAALTGVQFFAVPARSDFKSNYFPWISDSHESDKEQRMHIALWAAIPFTYTAAYFDQLSYQFEKMGMLPPAFLNHDIAASLLSTFVPGGGHFYKGYRYTGWLFYTSELSLLSYSMYNLEDRSGKISLSALALVKIIDIASAAFLSPSYSVYKREYGINTPSVNMSVKEDYDNGQVFTAGISLNF